jgi:RimJ/RimL family protein N-acetyltransferase
MQFSMDIHYRKLLPPDTIQYREIRLEALKLFPESFGSDYESEAAKPKLHMEIGIEQQAADTFLMGAFDGEKLFGICGFMRDLRPKVQHRGLIIQMYIQPAYQGKKLGLQLLQATTAEAFKTPEVEQIVLGVITHNISAIKTYEQAGFKEFGTHPNYLKIGDRYFDERLMVLYK